MPVPRHLRLTAIGSLGAIVTEQFSFGIAIARPGGATSLAFDQGLADDYADDVAAFFARSTSGISADARLRQVKLALIGTDGKYETDPLTKDFNVPGAGVGGVRYAPQVSLAVSLGTDRRGASGRGRFYLPAPSMQLRTDYTMSDTDKNGVRGSVVTLLQDLNNEPGVDFNDQVVGVASSKGFFSPVTTVRVGAALDTIRSRRRDVPELYSAEAPV